jgi:hypothetical protein
MPSKKSDHSSQLIMLADFPGNMFTFIEEKAPV